MKPQQGPLLPSLYLLGRAAGNTGRVSARTGSRAGSVRGVSPAAWFPWKRMSLPPSLSWHPLGRSCLLQTCIHAHLRGLPVAVERGKPRQLEGGTGRGGRGQPQARGHPSGAKLPSCCSHPLPVSHFLPSWAPSLAASLLPVVYFLFCYPAEEVGGEYPWPPSSTSFVFRILREGNGGSPEESSQKFTPGLT